jgi:hypothetical protein
MKPAIIIAAVAVFFTGTAGKVAPGRSLPFEVTPVTVPVIPGRIDEASGIADSRKNPGFIWVQQDSGNPPELFLLSYQGMVMKRIPVKGVFNRDWEDIVVSKGPVKGRDYIYIAETGDNDHAYADYMIYRFPEPSASAEFISDPEQIRFEYPDQTHDVEAILVDPETLDIFLLTKQDSLSRIYVLPYPQRTDGINTAVFLGQMTVGGISSASLSMDGKEILVKTYTNIYYWERPVGETIEDALKRTPLSLGYVLEPQGEAICFRNDNTGFFTLSEKPFFAASVPLSFYRRR